MISPARFGLEADLPVTVGSKADEQLNAAAQTWAGGYRKSSISYGIG